MNYRRARYFPALDRYVLDSDRARLERDVSQNASRVEEMTYKQRW